MRNMLINVLLLVGLSLSLLTIGIGLYRIISQKEACRFRDFLHIPLRPGNFMAESGAHNIVDGIAGLVLVYLVYTVSH